MGDQRLAEKLAQSVVFAHAVLVVEQYEDSADHDRSHFWDALEALVCSVRDYRAAKAGAETLPATNDNSIAAGGAEREMGR